MDSTLPKKGGKKKSFCGGRGREESWGKAYDFCEGENARVKETITKKYLDESDGNLVILDKNKWGFVDILFLKKRKWEIAGLVTVNLNLNNYPKKNLNLNNIMHNGHGG